MATSVPSIDVEDTAERYFGTPERILRRRKLRPGESGRLVSEDTDAGQNEVREGKRREQRECLRMSCIGYDWRY